MNKGATINPFEDGVVWLNETRFVDGQDVGGTTFSWPNDVVVNGLSLVFSNIMLSDSSITSTDSDKGRCRCRNEGAISPNQHL